MMSLDQAALETVCPGPALYWLGRTWRRGSEKKRKNVRPKPISFVSTLCPK